MARAKTVKNINGRQITRRIVKLLSVVNKPSLFRQVVQHSPDDVIKTICNAALTAQRSNIQIGSGRKKRLARHRNKIAQLTNQKIPIRAKRKLIQKGGFAWLPLLLSTVIGAVGNTLFERLRK